MFVFVCNQNLQQQNLFLFLQTHFLDNYLDIGFSKDSTVFLHTEHFILVDKSKRIRGIYNGTLRLEMMNLIEDIKSLKENE